LQTKSPTDKFLKDEHNQKFDTECQPEHGGEYEMLTSNRLMKEYSEDLLIFLSDSELRIIRNSIFATKGLKFKSQDLIEYFSAKEWYCPKYENVDSLLTVVEKENINFIKSFEGRIYPDTLDKYKYFVNLFLKGDRIIPIYFQNYYLGLSQHEFCCWADNLIKHSKYFDVVVYKYPECIPPDYIDTEMKIISVNKKGKVISSQDIYDGYQILNENELKSLHVIYNEETDDHWVADTLGLFYYYIDNNGIISRTQN